MKKTTESSSKYENLHKMPVIDLLIHMNNEDKTVPLAIEKKISSIEKLVNSIVDNLRNGGRLFYIGAGTSGRLGIVDASECPPTFGVDHGLVIGIIAGGDSAIRKAVEFAEDNTSQAWIDLQKHNISKKDFVIGIAASGTTPYVVGGIDKCRREGIKTGCITCNENSPLAKVSDFPIEIIVGPEFVTGSTRLKAGTAQKLCLNMISTSVMIKLGKVLGNKMVDMQLSNNKLIDRAHKMIMDYYNINENEAINLLFKYGNVRNVINNYKKN